MKAKVAHHALALLGAYQVSGLTIAIAQYAHGLLSRKTELLFHHFSVASGARVLMMNADSFLTPAQQKTRFELQ
ncbi:hypothetical protein Q0S22_03240 [Escherichia coli O93:H19]